MTMVMMGVMTVTKKKTLKSKHHPRVVCPKWRRLGFGKPQRFKHHPLTDGTFPGGYKTRGGGKPNRWERQFKKSQDTFDGVERRAFVEYTAHTRINELLKNWWGSAPFFDFWKGLKNDEKKVGVSPRECARTTENISRIEMGAARASADEIWTKCVFEWENSSLRFYWYLPLKKGWNLASGVR